MNRIRTRSNPITRALEYAFDKLETSWYAVACFYAIGLAVWIAANLLG